MCTHVLNKRKYWSHHSQVHRLGRFPPTNHSIYYSSTSHPTKTTTFHWILISYFIPNPSVTRYASSICRFCRYESAYYVIYRIGILVLIFSFSTALVFHTCVPSNDISVENAIMIPLWLPFLAKTWCHFMPWCVSMSFLRIH